MCTAHLRVRSTAPCCRSLRSPRRPPSCSFLRRSCHRAVRHTRRPGGKGSRPRQAQRACTPAWRVRMGGPWHTCKSFTCLSTWPALKHGPLARSRLPSPKQSRQHHRSRSQAAPRQRLRHCPATFGTSRLCTMHSWLPGRAPRLSGSYVPLLHVHWPLHQSMLLTLRHLPPQRMCTAKPLRCGVKSAGSRDAPPPMRG